MKLHYVIAAILFLTLIAPAPARTPVIVDTDIGDDIDDALALALVLKSPELEVRGITTVHGDAATRATLVCRMLHLIGRAEIPVAIGKSSPNPNRAGQMQYAMRPSFRKRPVKENAIEFMYAQLKANPGEITILTLGPLTNLAELIDKHPDCKKWIKRVVAMAGALEVGYNGKPPAEPEWNVKQDIKAAQAVFASDLPLVVVPLDATHDLKLEGKALSRVLQLGELLNNQLHALYQLWEKPTPILFDPLAVSVCIDEKWCKLEDRRLEIDDKGLLRAVRGKANARIALKVDRDKFMAWYVERVAPKEDVKPIPLKITNPSKPVARGNFPNQVHVIENYETDIERRWWLSGKLEDKEKAVPPGSKRACRGVLTNDFDDLQGDPKAIYTAVIFNPVPGPPMGKNTRLGFRYWLKGTDRLRVQIYTLSNGYHRCLTLENLPQEKWQELTVDMTQCRKPDGKGGPLSENERIDDIQFYTDPGVELLIDDILLYDAALEGDERPFPARPLFTGWFDTGRQGQEWPGTFEVVPHAKPRAWKAAKSVLNPELKQPWIRLDLRGRRPLNAENHLRFRYLLTGAENFQIRFVDGDKKTEWQTVKSLNKDEWSEANFRVPLPAEKWTHVREIQFLLPPGGTLLLDDVLLY